MKIGNVDLFVEDLGNPNGDAIVFLNGVMASTNSWYVIAKPFIKKGFRVILHDFKGQLKSDKPDGPYSFKEHADEACMLLEKLGINKAHFIGTSYGGEVAMRIGIDHPEIVKSLSIIDSVSELDAHLIEEVENWEKLCRNADGYRFFWEMSRSIYHPQFIASNKDFLEERAQAIAKIDPSYFKGQIELYQTFLADVTMTDELELISVPTMIICGENDMLKPIKFSHIMHQRIAGSEYVTIPNCAHVAIFEKPNELISILLGFIDKLYL